MRGGENMGNMMEHGIPLEVISKGRDYDAVLVEYKRIWEDAQKFVTESGKTGDEVFASTMMCAAYRIYLLGVEDGMKEAEK